MKKYLLKILIFSLLIIFSFSNVAFSEESENEKCIQLLQENDWWEKANQIAGTPAWINATSPIWIRKGVYNLEPVMITNIARKDSHNSQYESMIWNIPGLKIPAYIVTVQKEDGTIITIGEWPREINKLYEISLHLYRFNPYERYDWPEDVWEVIRKKQVFIGMTGDQMAMAKGIPDKINKTETRWGTWEQWIYGNTYLYLENHILVAIQD